MVTIMRIADEYKQISASYTIKCVETNTVYNSRTCTFDYGGYHKNAGWNHKKLVTNSLKYDSLTFQCKINILEEYDLDGYVVRDQAQRNRSLNMLKLIIFLLHHTMKMH